MESSTSKTIIVSIGKHKFSLDEFIGAVFNSNVEIQLNTASVEQLEQLSKKRFPPVKIEDCLDRLEFDASSNTVTKPLVRMIMLLRAVSFLQARAAVRPVIVQYLADLLNNDLLPTLPNPEVANDKQILTALYLAILPGTPIAEQCASKNIVVPEMTPNEVKRFTMGCVATQAYYIFSAATAKGIARIGDVVTALSCEAASAFTEPFQQAYYDVARPYQTAIEVASIYRWLLDGSSSVNKPKSTAKVQNVEEIRQSPIVSAALRDAAASVSRAARVEINSAEALGHINDWQHDPSLHPAYMHGSISSLTVASKQAIAFSTARIQHLLDNSATYGPLSSSADESLQILQSLQEEFLRLQAKAPADIAESATTLQTVFYAARVVYHLQLVVAFEALVATHLTCSRDKITIEASEKAIIAKKEALERRNAQLAAEGKPIIQAKEKDNAKDKAARGLIFGHGITVFRNFIMQSGLIAPCSTPINADTDVSQAVSKFRSLLCPLKDKTMSEIDTALTAVNQTFSPKLPKGTRDCGPELMAIREKAFSIITACFQRHGAVGIDTPVFERKETLTGKYGEDSKLIYDLADQGGEILSLRYDLTVPFARYCATNGVTNIKRYHMAKVYRRDQPAMNRGRFREFYQCDYDVAGIYPPMVADAETLKVMSEILSNIDIGNFKIKLNHRKLLDAVMTVAGVPFEKLRPICSAVDKLDKETWATVKDEMCNEKGLSEEVADRLEKYVTIPPGSPYELLATLRNDANLSSNEAAQQAFSDFQLLFDYLDAMNGLEHISFDMSLARGLDYYTGIIYEAVLTDTDQVGSIAAGGRYDGLVGMFSGKNVPAVGVSIGIERIFTILEARERAKQANIKTTKTQVLVASVGANMLMPRMRLASDLWKASIPTEFLYHENPNIRKQMEFAFDGQIPLVAWIGEDELRDGVVTLKKLSKDKDDASEAMTVKRDELVDKIREIMANL